MTKVLIYSGLVWHGISESHCHNLARCLARDHLVYYLEVPYCNDKARPHICNFNDVDIPDNVKIISHKIISHKRSYVFGFWYFLRAQVHSIVSFFKYRNNFDVAILYNLYDFPFLLLCDFFNKKVIYAMVDDYPELTTNKFTKWFLQISENTFIARSHASFCTAKSLLKKDPKSTYIPNTIRLETNPSSILIPKRYTSIQPYRVGILGTLGQWTDIETINETAKMMPKVQFHIIGDGERKKDIQQLPNIILHGQVNKKQVNELLKKINIGLICFKINKITNSVSPIKLFEYFQQGIPVIASKTEELLNYSYLISYYTSPKELATRLEYFMQEPTMALVKGRQGQEYVKHVNWNTIRNKYEEIIKKVI